MTKPENDSEKTADIYGIQEALARGNAPMWPVEDPDEADDVEGEIW